MAADGVRKLTDEPRDLRVPDGFNRYGCSVPGVGHVRYVGHMRPTEDHPGTWLAATDGDGAWWAVRLHRWLGGWR